MSVPLFSWIYISQSHLNRLTPASLPLYPEYHRIKEIFFCKISGKDTDLSHKVQVSAQSIGESSLHCLGCWLVLISPHNILKQSKRRFTAPFLGQK